MAKSAPINPMTGPSAGVNAPQLTTKPSQHTDSFQGHAMTKGVHFEGSKRDVEPKGMREGSKREEAFDRGVVSKQSHPHAPHREKKMRGEGSY